MTRGLNPDRAYTDPIGRTSLALPGRSLLLVRNVGHAPRARTPCSARTAGEIFEGILDALATALISLHDLARVLSRLPPTAGRARCTSSSPSSTARTRPPSPTGPFRRPWRTPWTCPANTLKVGVMDEERRTTVNLKPSASGP